MNEVINAVKVAKAEKAFDKNVQVYGSESAALKSLDCTSKSEAVRMLSHVQTVKIYKANEKVVVE
jgi:hypothetical protein